jgi:RNA polymerase sigma-70 factor (ECF subfamily)
VPDDLDARIADSLAADARLALASLVRILGDLDRAEDALQDAVGEALTAWRARGVPDDPRAWLVTVARRRAIDAARRARRGAVLVAEHYAAAELHGSVGLPDPSNPPEILRDDPLRLVFTCCHPAIPMRGRVALALKVVCGLETDEIARAFLVGEAAMKRRISRAKAFVRDRRLPYRVPTGDALAERLPAVLAVIYLLYNEGHSATAGASHLRRRIAGHALALARMVAELLPASEAVALLALLVLHESRAEARTSCCTSPGPRPGQTRTGRSSRSIARTGRAGIRRGSTRGWRSPGASYRSARSATTDSRRRSLRSTRARRPLRRRAGI